MGTIGIAEYNHNPGECYNRQIAELTGPCGDPRCKQAFLKAFARGVSQAYFLVGECVPKSKDGFSKLPD